MSTEPELLPCPFCNEPVMLRNALWPSEGDVDAIIHAAPTDCPMHEFSSGVLGTNIAELWNRRARNAPDGGEVDGWKLVPVEPTEEMLNHGACYEDPDDCYGSNPLYEEGELSRDVYRAMLEHAPPAPTASPASGVEVAMGPVQWAVERWHAEVANRPLKNVHRRALDTTWRQVIRHFGGDPEIECGPSHDDLVAANPAAAVRSPEQGEVVRELVEAFRELRKAFVSAWGYEPGPENTLYYPTLQRVDAVLAKIGANHDK